MAETEIDVGALTFAYRRLVLWFGGQLLLNIASFGLRALEAEGAIGALLSLLVVVGMFATIAALTYYGFRTAQALALPVAWRWGFAMFVPCANIISLIALSSKATQAWAARGISVGLLGPRIVAADKNQRAG
jgi:hypothetical protein